MELWYIQRLLCKDCSWDITSFLTWSLFIFPIVVSGNGFLHTINIFGILNLKEESKEIITNPLLHIICFPQPKYSITNLTNMDFREYLLKWFSIQYCWIFFLDRRNSSFEADNCSDHCQFSLSWIHAATISVRWASGIPTTTTLAIPGCCCRIASTYFKQIIYSHFYGVVNTIN